MQISIANAIQVARRIGAAAAEVITTNLKMWLGFETSETLGKEEVVNGDFATDSDWGKGTGWSIANDVAIQSGGVGQLSQTGVLAAGKSYSVSVTIDSIASGTSLKVSLGSAGAELLFSNVGATTLIGSTSSSVGNEILYLLGNESGFSGSISNISVKELTQITPDKSGNNNVGELFTGKALEFDGNNDSVTFSSFPTPIKSIVFWYKPLVSQQFDPILWLGGSNRGVIKISNSQGVIICTNLLGKVIYVNGVQTESVTLNQWHRVVINIPSKTLLNLAFGAAISDNLYGHCQLSDIQFYNENLSLDDIAYDYANPQNLVTDREGSSIELSDLRGYWHLSEGAGSIVYDSSGGGNNGTINGATHEPAQPRIPQLGMMNWAKSTPVADEVTLIPNPNNTSQDILGNAVRDRLNSFNLDGSGYSSVANNSSIKPTSALSIECWIKTPDVSSASKYISDADVGATRFFLMQVGSKARFKIATTEINSAANLTDNTWYYIAGTWNGSTMTLYVDEEAPVTISKSGTITYDTDDLFIGSRLGTGEYFDGLISDVRLYDRALTSDEVENNYKAGLSAHTND